MRNLFTYGEPVVGKTVPIPKTILSSYSSVMGALYEVDMDVEVKDPSKLTEENFEIVKQRLYEELHAKVKYFEVEEYNSNYRAVMQLEGSPFAFTALVALLAELAPLIGLVVVGVVVYYIIKKHPLTTVALMLGTVMLIGVPGFLRALGAGAGAGAGGEE